jgi:hypothetical protein
MTPEPVLSVVVGLTAGDSAVVRRCLEALAVSIAGAAVECLVPFDARLNDVDGLSRDFPWVHFIDCRTRIDLSNFRFSREHHDLLRAAGLLAARAPLVALIEDQELPAPQWVSAMLAAHRGTEAGIGGAIENRATTALTRAIYYCDFGRYENPLPPSLPQSISDVNSSYKRAALDRIRHLWSTTFQEITVNTALLQLGAQLRFEPAAIVYQMRPPISLRSALAERYIWGRSYSGTRARSISGLSRTAHSLASPILPFLLTFRILRDGVRRHTFRPRLAVAPLVLLLQTAWTAGEITGYLTGRPSS